MGHGGKRQNSGRKRKSEEAALLKRLSPLEDLAFIALKSLIEAENMQAIKLYFEYMYGKPKEIEEEDKSKPIQVIITNGVELKNNKR